MIIVHTDPLYDTACLIQSYTQHKLLPHIDEANEHVRHFLKIFYLNKGVDFIDLPSIFRDKIGNTPILFRSISRILKILLFVINTKSLFETLLTITTKSFPTST